MFLCVRFIPSLALVLQEHGHQVTICPGDADLTTAETALKIQIIDWSHATVAAYDTGILVMLLSNWRHELADKSVRHEAKRSIKNSLQIISIKETISLLPKVLVDKLLFIHTWSGCDAVSARYSKVKTKLL